MDLQKLPPDSLNWSLDFSPHEKWPPCLPVLCANELINGLVVVAGFERKNQPSLDVLVIPGSASQILMEIWPREDLLPLEGLRLKKLLGNDIHDEYLLNWPLSFQHFLDQKQIPLKNLKPLAHLDLWKTEISEKFPSLSLTSSQIREALDLLCDLKIMKKNWQDCDLPNKDGAAWLQHLKQIRFIRTSTNDDVAQNKVRNLPWPRGVQARWERHGDQAGLVFQTRINSPLEWKRLQENLAKLNIGDSLWT